MSDPTYEDSLIFKSDVNNLEGYYVYVFWEGDVPFYVGLGQKNRWRQHFHNSHERLLKDNPYKHNKLRKIIDSGAKVGVEIVKHGLSKEDAESLEIDLISKYKRKCDGGPLTNMSSGGESGAAGRKHTEEHKEHISMVLRGKNSKVDEELVKKAKLLFHYRGVSVTELQKMDEFNHVTRETIQQWISKHCDTYSYVMPHLCDHNELWEEKRQEVRNLWKKGQFNYTQIGNILGLDRCFVSRVCRGVSP